MTVPSPARDAITGVPYPTSPFMKYLFKLPILLYRMGLGPVIGRKIMILTTTGRKSGLPRRTAIEYNVHNGRKFIMAGWGGQSDWYKNLAADPRVTIQTADGAESAIAHRLTEDEELIDAYRFVENNPAMQVWMKLLNAEITREQFLAQRDQFYLVRFDPTAEPTPPPVAADLAWVWLVVGGGLLALALSLGRRR